EHILATGLQGGAQVVAADVNRDGRLDLVVVSSELVWFENPDWTRHTLATGISRPVSAVVDIDRVVLADAAGVLSVVAAGSVTEIDRVPAARSLHWADLDGNGRRVAVTSALAYYDTRVWMRHPIARESATTLHITDWDGDGRDDILAATPSGILRFHLATELDTARRWQRVALTTAAATGVAALRDRKARLLCALEAGALVVYREEKSALRRQVVDTQIDALLAVSDSARIVAGKGRSVYLYSSQGSKWTSTALDDGGMRAASCVAADLNADGRTDIACLGAETANLKWYENR
ncbi:MAG: hypothetical protein ACRD96_19180, partial [Bryobacteraceae bacterium]